MIYALGIQLPNFVREINLKSAKFRISLDCEIGEIQLSPKCRKKAGETSRNEAKFSKMKIEIGEI